MNEAAEEGAVYNSGGAALTVGVYDIPKGDDGRKSLLELLVLELRSDALSESVSSSESISLSSASPSFSGCCTNRDGDTPADGNDKGPVAKLGTCGNIGRPVLAGCAGAKLPLGANVVVVIGAGGWNPVPTPDTENG